MKKVNIDNLRGTEFQKKVWKEILKIPEGETITYKELAKRIEKQKAIRAVANAVGANPALVLIPCHRVVRSDGSLGGYSGKGRINLCKTKLQKKICVAWLQLLCEWVYLLFLFGSVISSSLMPALGQSWCPLGSRRFLAQMRLVLFI